MGALARQWLCLSRSRARVAAVQMVEEGRGGEGGEGTAGEERRAARGRREDSNVGERHGECDTGSVGPTGEFWARYHFWRSW